MQRALTTPVDPVLLAPPSARVVTGLVLLGASYLVAWPAIGLLGVLAVWLRRPMLIAAGPVLYGLSWVIFSVGLLLMGTKSIRTGRALGLLLVRKLAEKHLLP